MSRAVEGSGAGPFAYYPVTGESIHQVAERAEAPARSIEALRGRLSGQDGRLVAAVAGELRENVTVPSAMADGNAQQVARAARFASGVLRLFADAVIEYDRLSADPRSVESLNAAYLQASLDDFGLDAGDDEKGGAAADRDYDDDLRAARAEFVGPGGSLTAEYHRLGEQLDLWAEHAAAMLKRGPNPSDVAELWMCGALTSDAPEVWSELHLGNVPTFRLPVDVRDGLDDRRSLDDLSRDEQWELWEQHGLEAARAAVTQGLLDDQVAQLRDLSYQVDPNYWEALAAGLPEDVAERIAEASSETVFDFLSPYARAGEVAYGLTFEDLAEAVREDPLSWKAAVELGMMAPLGRVGKLRNLDEVLHNADDARDVKRVLDRIDEKGSPFPGYSGGKTWRNDRGQLPDIDNAGDPMRYREWDLDLPGSLGRTNRRILTGSDGSAYLTYDHYDTFIKIRDGVD